jgi:hypothetical protein
MGSRMLESCYSCARARQLDWCPATTRCAKLVFKRMRRTLHGVGCCGLHVVQGGN